LYKFLGEEPFEHKFEGLGNLNRERDMETYGLEDMHEVRSVLKSTSKDPLKVLSSYVLDKCKGMDFWRNNPYTWGVQKIPNYIQIKQNQIKIITEEKDNA